MLPGAKTQTVEHKEQLQETPDVKNLTGEVVISSSNQCYKLGERIGSGGMAVVYKAAKDGSNKEYAIKIIRPGLKPSSSFLRFQREAKILRSLNHPNISLLYDDNFDTALPFLVMAYANGGTLKEPKLSMPLNSIQVLEIFSRICNALYSVHNLDNSICHRDLKPSNILLIEKDGKIIPQLSDFGLAHLDKGGAVDYSGGETLTGSNVIVGTPAYMSPEQTLPNGHFEQRSDLYSLGVSLCYIFTGIEPFNGNTNNGSVDIIKKMTEIREVAPVSPRKLNNTIPPDLEILISRLIRKNPIDRPANAREVEEEFLRIARLPQAEHIKLPEVKASVLPSTTSGRKVT
ncbi:MAG: serine/threonine protein kinase [Candidatus Melainabacteria bacterium]|nr:serine/threonine protein kinase [Candidatus Melainabacteria bacterium]